MRELTTEEKKQLDKDLEWKLKLVEKETEATKEAIKAVDKAGRDFFRKYVDFYNAARKYYYDKLEDRLKYRGDFETMEVYASVSEEYELILSGVWNARHLTVKRLLDGFQVNEGDGVTEKKLSSENQLTDYLMEALLRDHPAVHESAEKLYVAKEQLKKMRYKVTGK